MTPTDTQGASKPVGVTSGDKPLGLPQGAGETRVEWRNVYQRLDGSEWTPASELGLCSTREECEEAHASRSERWRAQYKRVAMVETTTTITRIPVREDDNAH